MGRYGTAYDSAIVVQGEIEATDSDIGSALRDTGRNILTALTFQLKAQQPNLDAILTAGTGVSAIASGMIGSAPPSAKSDAKRSPPQPEGTSEPACNADLKKVRSLIQRANSLKVAWKTTSNAIGDLKDGCAMVPVSVAPLAVAQNAVTLVPGTTFNLVYSGGRSPIHAQWVKDIPKGDQLSLTPHPGSSMFQITRPPSDKSATTFTLRVFDSAAIPSSTEVSVAVPAPAPAK